MVSGKYVAALGDVLSLLSFVLCRKHCRDGMEGKSGKPKDGDGTAGTEGEREKGREK